jgi:ligand-binding sensor domain-containing protein
MRIRLYAILIFLFTLPTDLVNAQQQIFKNYTVNDGLIANDIRRIFQDSKGFLWIGTMEGLSKYDGNTFTNFTRSKGLSYASFSSSQSELYQTVYQRRWWANRNV